MKKIKIMVVQYKINYLKPDANLRKFERLIRKYKFLKPDLIIFPEYGLTGPLFGHYDLAFKINDPIFEKLTEIAKKYKTNIIPGSFVRRVDNKNFNSTCFIDSDGDILGFYDKRTLWSSEKRFLTAGKNEGIFETKIGKIAIQICADLSSPRISDAYKNLKPEIVVNLALWSEEDMKAARKKVPNNIEKIQTEVLVRARSLESKAYTIFCNYAGQVNIVAKSGRNYGETSIGNTMIVNPYGEIISKVSDNREQLLMVELDLSKCHWANY